MRVGRIRLVVAGLALCAGRAAAQTPPASESMTITAHNAWTWRQGEVNVVQLEDPVTINLDRVRLSARNAVIWVLPQQGAVLTEQQVQIALVGNATIVQGGVKRTDERLFVTATVRGGIRLSAEQRLTRDQSGSALYLQAARIREENGVVPQGLPPGQWRAPRPFLPPPPPVPTTAPTRPAVSRPAPAPSTVQFRLPSSAQITHNVEGYVTVILSGGVTMIYRGPAARATSFNRTTPSCSRG